MSQKTEIVRDAVRRFQQLPNLTIAKHILNTHGALFDNDIEKIRSSVRFVRGKKGKKEPKDKSLFINGKKLKMPQTWRKIRTPYHLSEGLWLVLSDIHVPFHEPKPLEAAIRAGQAEKVTGIFLNGDVMDCAAVSFWPQAHRDFNKEIETVIDFFDFLRQEFPNAEIVFKPGNHEYRLPRLFLSKAPELVETPYAAMETVIGFAERGIEFLDYHQLVYAGLLPILHGHEVGNITRAVNPARGLFLKTKTFSACSHLHTTSENTTKTVEGTLLTTWSFACLCDLQPDYNPFCNDWNWGFGLINIEKKGDFEVINKRILPNGKVR